MSKITKRVAVRSRTASKRNSRATKSVQANKKTVTDPTACDGTCGKCQACRDDFFFDQICDEVEGVYESTTKQ